MPSGKRKKRTDLTVQVIKASPLDLKAPDDTGTDTLKRYRYQAELFAPYCFECATNGRIVSIVAEHFEDVLIEFDDRWHFVQVKTRNANLGPWKLGDAHDGIESLWRSHKSISQRKDINASYALFLEGPIAKDDLLSYLVVSDSCRTTMSSTPNPDLVTKIAKKLRITHNECQDFLRKVTVVPNQPTRQDVASRHIHLLGQIALGVPHKELEVTYGRLVDTVLNAMAAVRIGDALVGIISPSGMVNVTPEIQKKILTRDALKKCLGSIAYGPNLLLRRLVTPDMPRPTDLEMKLLAAGADATVIQDAKSLRANASIREAEILAQSYDDLQLEDVRARLLVLGNSVIQKHRQEATPAVNGYGELLATLMGHEASCDPNRLFRQDAYFLFGELCVLADECKFDWGVTLA